MGLKNWLVMLQCVYTITHLVSIVYKLVSNVRGVNASISIVNMIIKWSIMSKRSLKHLVWLAGLENWLVMLQCVHGVISVVLMVNKVIKLVALGRSIQ